MNTQAYAARLDKVIKEIGEKLDVDISRSALPKIRHPRQRVLFSLEVINEALEPQQAPVDFTEELLARIESIEGIGAATMTKIREGLN